MGSFDQKAVSLVLLMFLWKLIPHVLLFPGENLIDFNFLEKHTKTINLEELLNIFPNMLKGEISGRVLVDLSK